MLSHRVIIAAFALSVTTLINAQTTNQHVVMRGETFASIANKYGITEQQLKNANSAHSTCYVGLKLTIPAAKETDTPQKSIAATNPAESKQGDTTTGQVSNTISPQTYTKEDNKAAKKEKRKRFWEKFDAILTTTSDALVAMADGLDKGNSASKSAYATNEVSNPVYKSTDIVNESSNQKADGDMLLIADLIKKNQNNIANCENEIERKMRELDQKAQKLQSNQPSYIRVGGKLIKTGSKERQKVQKYTTQTKNGSTTVVIEPEHYSRNIEIASKKAVIKQYQHNIQWLSNYQRSHGEYISKEVYRNYLQGQEELRKEDRERRKALRKELEKERMRTVYGHYVERLMDAHYLPEHNKYYYEQREQMQSEMRRLRQKYDLNKSPWEDWDGFHNPTK